MEALHVGDGIRDSVVIVTTEGIKICIGWGWVVREVFARVVVDICKHTHVTLFVRWGRGDKCRGSGLREWGC